MRDPVAEVLAQRQRTGRDHPAWLLISLVLHAGLALLLYGMAQRTTHTDLRNVLNVRFAGVPAASIAPAGGAAAAARPPAKPVAPAPKVEPPKPVETPKPAAAAPEKSLFGKAKPGKKPAASAEPAPAAPAPQPRPGAGAGSAAGSGSSPIATASGVGGVGTAGLAGIEGGDFPFTIYVERMLTLIGNHWFRPQSPGEVVVGVVFTILRDGTVRNAKVEKASGNSTFDRAALRAVIETSPLPPLPFAYSGTELTVHLTFH